MKTTTAFIIGAMVFLSFAAVPAPQNTTSGENKSFDGFSSVRSHRQGKGAEVSWSFASTNAVGFTVRRTNEDPNDPYSVWVTVSSMAANSSRSYKCHDENPFPGLINYQVVAVMGDNSTMTSPITTVRIVAH